MEASVQNYFEKEKLTWRDEQLLLRRIILNFDLQEDIKWGRPTYSKDGKNIIGLSGFKNYFTIWFFQGVFLTDKKKVLVNAQEGKTKALRQWRFYSTDEIDESIIVEYIQEAIDNHLKGKELKVNRSVNIDFDLAPELVSVFEQNMELKIAFEKLTPGKQKEYSNYISEAKRFSTKQSRMLKIEPMILNGVGLNDKYKNC